MHSIDINPMHAESAREPSVAVITAACGQRHLLENVRSVASQTYRNIIHYIVVDGRSRRNAVLRHLKELEHCAEVVVLPEPTGCDGFNGHRIYGAFPFLVNADYVCFLDEDNVFSPTHVAELVNVILKHRLDWGYSLRRIINLSGRVICNDDCDSLGLWGSWYGGQNHIDANCYMLRRDLAVETSWIWNRKGYSSDYVDPDKALCRWLLSNNLNGFTSGEYTLLYRVSTNEKGARGEYFREGNAVMKSLYRYFPWRKPVLECVNVKTDYRRIVALHETSREEILERLREEGKL